MTTQPSDWAVARARLFHDTYERLAPQFGYETRPDTKAFDPESPNGRLMTAVIRELDASGGGQEPFKWEGRRYPNGLKRYLTQRQYEAQTKAMQAHYKPICEACAAPRAAEAGDTELMDWFSGGIDRNLSQCPTGEWCAQDDVVLACYGDTPRAAIRAAMGAVGSD